jgi:hypothetical protein
MRWETPSRGIEACPNFAMLAGLMNHNVGRFGHIAGRLLRP